VHDNPSSMVPFAVLVGGSQPHWEPAARQSSALFGHSRAGNKRGGSACSRVAHITPSPAALQAIDTLALAAPMPTVHGCP